MEFLSPLSGLSSDDRKRRKSEQIVNKTLAFSLRDPTHWSQLVTVYQAQRSPWRGITWERLPISRKPSTLGAMWMKVFHSIYNRYRQQLARVGEDDRWASFSISYIALRKCVAHRKHEEFSYVYSACKNAHKRFLRRRAAPLPKSLAVDDDADFWLDFEAALDLLEPKDATICRLRLAENRTFGDIGERLGGIDRSTVMRRFNRSLPTIQGVMGAYQHAN